VAVPFLDDLQAQERRIQFQGLAPDAYGFGFAPRANHGGFGFDLRLKLSEAGAGGFLFGDQSWLRWRFEFVREIMLRITMSSR